MQTKDSGVGRYTDPENPMKFIDNDEVETREEENKIRQEHGYGIPDDMRTIPTKE